MKIIVQIFLIKSSPGAPENLDKKIVMERGNKEGVVLGPVLGLGRADLPRKNRRATHIDRLAALMDVLGYCGRGGQKRFADDIEIEARRFNNICRGSDLSRQVAGAIFARFGVPLEFLWYGLPGWGMDRDLETRLREWERQTGRRIFMLLVGQ